MRDSPYLFHTPAFVSGFAGFKIPVFKIIDCKAQTVEFAGLPTRRTCHLAGKAVYEAIPPPRKPPPITVWKLLRVARPAFIGLGNRHNDESWYRAPREEHPTAATPSIRKADFPWRK